MNVRPLQVRPDLDYPEAYEELDRRLRGLAGVLIGLSMDSDIDAPVSDAAALGAEVVQDCRALVECLRSHIIAARGARPRLEVAP